MSGWARMLSRVVSALNLVLSVPVAYLGGMTVIATIVASRKQVALADRDDPTTRFVVLVPAHDEAATIGAMVASALHQDYPRALFATHVVADNCVDATADTARSLGVEVHERFDATDPGKGPALNWLIAQLLERDEPFDVAVFVDADTIIAPDFLQAMDRRFVGGAVAVQGRYGVRDAFESTATTLRFCSLAGRHYARPLARTAIGGSCGLFGNGMAFTRDLVARRRWTSHLVEDMEFQLELLVEGILVDYEPLARVEAEMPRTFADSVTQHRRWELGRADIARRYLVPLVRRTVRPARGAHRRAGGRVAAADAVLDMCVPPLSLLAAATTLTTASAVVLATVDPRRRRGNVLAGAALVAMVFLHVIGSLHLVGAPRQAYRSLLHAPHLAIWKVRVLLQSRGGAQSEWIRTRRNAEEAVPHGDGAS